MECKLCDSPLVFGSEIWDSQLPTCYRYNCANCSHYYILMKNNYEVESECLEVGNLFATYFVNSQKLRFGKVIKDGFIFDKDIVIKRLTPNLAKFYFEKFKMMVIFS